MCFQALDCMLFAKCNTSFKAFMYTLHNKSSFNAFIMSCNAPYDALYEFVNTIIILIYTPFRK